MTIGRWSNGELIDIQFVPPLKLSNVACGVQLVQPWESKNGGVFEAIYRFREKQGPHRWMYELYRVAEVMPPRPPQIHGFTDNIRLPEWHAADEAERRRLEWAEALSH